ncbi:MAG: glycosyltransferase family 4 protein [Actinomycetota bacterium]
MRIALVANLYPPVQTGTSFYTADLATALVKAGHEVVVVTCGSGPMTEKRAASGVTEVRLPSWKLPAVPLLLGFDDFRVAASPRNARRLTDVLARHQVEIVHCAGHFLDLAPLGVAAARRLGIPSVCSVHTILHFPRHRLVERAIRLVDATAVAALVTRRCDAVLALDGPTEKYVRERYGVTRVHRIPWGVGFDFDAHERVPHAEGAPLRIVSLGHVTDMRNRRTLVEACARLEERGVPFELKIVGKECTDAPRALAHRLGLDDRITFTGELSRAQLLDELVHADVEAHWITNPGVGNASMEAMATGLVVMMWADPDTLGFADLETMGNCILVDPEEVEEIADHFVRLGKDRQLVNDIGSAARATARSHFTWPTAAEGTAGVYEKVVATSAASSS